MEDKELEQKINEIFAKHFVPKEYPTKLGEWGYHTPSIKKDLADFYRIQSIKDRKDELSHFEGWEEWFDRDNHTILTVNERRQALDNLHQKEIEG